MTDLAKSIRLRRVRVSGIWLATVALFAITFVLEPRTFSASHLLNILQIASFLGIAAIGQTLVILVGGLDLSVGGVITLVNIAAASAMDGKPDRMIAGVVLCLGLGATVGVVNGLLVTKAHITPLIATLAMQSILFGGALLYTKGAPSGAVPSEFFFLGQGRLFDAIPVASVVWLGLGVAFVVLTRRTVYGRRLYAIGANPRAAHFVGMRVDPMLVSVYALSGLMAAVAGLILTAYIGLPAFGIGEKYLLVTVAAVAVGGTALTGGVGGVALSIGGAIFMTQLISLTNILQVGSGGQLFVQGAVIVLGTALYERAKARQRGQEDGGRASSPTTAGIDDEHPPRSNIPEEAQR